MSASSLMTSHETADLLKAFKSHLSMASFISFRCFLGLCSPFQEGGAEGGAEAAAPAEAELDVDLDLDFAKKK